MTASYVPSLALAGLLLLVLPSCANSALLSETTLNAAPVIGVDLGPSSRVPVTQVAMMGAGHENHLGHAMPVQPVHAGHDDAHGTGTVNAVDAAHHTVNLSHNPIPAIGWPAMTMDFHAAPSVDLSRLKPGTRVNFSIGKGKDGMYQLESVEPARGGK